MSQALALHFPEGFFSQFPSLSDPGVDIESLKCAICLQICRDPVIESACGHTFCKNCLQNLFKTSKLSGAKCPHSRSPISDDQVGPNRAVQDLITNLKVNCYLRDRGCKWQGFYRDVENHTKKECVYAQMKCLNQGCSFLGDQILAKTHASECDFRVIKCKQCDKDFIWKTIRGHEEECPMRPVLCIYGCREVIPRQFVQQHSETKCPNKVIRCKFAEFGCQVQVKRFRYLEHIQQSYEDHIKMISEDMDSHKEKCDKLDEEVHSLKKGVEVKALLKTLNKKKDEIVKLEKSIETANKHKHALAGKNEELEHMVDILRRTRELYENNPRESSDPESFAEGKESYLASQYNHSISSDSKSILNSIVQTSTIKKDAKEVHPLEKRKEGWLYKRSKVLNKWRKRWCVLTSTDLFTYEKENASHSTENISLRSIEKIKYEGIMDGGKYHEILIKQIKGQVYHLKTESLENLKDWIHQIESLSKCQVDFKLEG